MGKEELNQAKVYNLVKNQLFVLEITLTVLYLLICLMTDLSKSLRNIAYHISENTFFAVAMYLFLFFVIGTLVMLPLNFYRGYIIEHKFALSNLRIEDWIKKEAKKQMIMFLVLLFMAQVIYILLSVSAGSWWLKAAIIWIVISIFLTKIAPTVIMPFFYKYKPLNDQTLKRKVFSLAQRTGTNTCNIGIIDFSRETKKANAAVIGIGKNKRIVFTDTLIENFYLEEIIVILAHELAHEKYKHVWRIIFFNAVGTIIGFYLVGLVFSNSIDIFGFYRISDVANFPLLCLLLFLFGIITMPIESHYSRLLEKEADLYALTVTNDPEAFISAMIRLGRQNLADMQPPKWVEFLLYDHPSIINRIKMAELFWEKQETKKRFV
ncbi:MAG: M48 family metallopeptidase [Candidatus Omnitrophota bacterium]